MVRAGTSTAEATTRHGDSEQAEATAVEHRGLTVHASVADRDGGDADHPGGLHGDPGW